MGERIAIAHSGRSVIMLPGNNSPFNHCHSSTMSAKGWPARCSAAAQSLLLHGTTSAYCCCSSAFSILIIALPIASPTSMYVYASSP